MCSIAWRTAPRPPGCVVTNFEMCFTGSTASATAMG